jgi:phenylacetate-coenzyme A ligase PaaK-like adenylate-forming protein
MCAAVEYLRKGQKDLFWKKCCGFLDLRIEEFMHIQERLLLEQIKLISNTPIGKHFLGEHMPRSVEEFRWKVPITTYENYDQFFACDDRSYPDTAVWSHTSGRSGKYKWIPYTRRAYQKLGERVLSGVVLAAARERGDIRLKEGDVLVYNTPPRPYISGVVLRALGDEFNFRFVPEMENTEDMDFQERIKMGFSEGMRSGIDILGSMSAVLVKMGEQFAEGAQTAKLSPAMLHPTTMTRMIRGYLRAKMEGRPMLPRDLWQLKAMPCGGADTGIYRDKISYYWGVEPYEQYGSTEEGAIATQIWNKKYMTFFPDAAFYEFIPEEEFNEWKRDPFYTPKTVLLDEVVPNKRYEVVLTNFYGKPLLRYRTYDIIEFPLVDDSETGVHLPQMSFVGRAMDFIDLAGWTGLIDERMVWQAIVNTGIKYVDWAIRKEAADSKPYLRLYIEPIDLFESEPIQQKVHEALKELNPFYADYENMLEKRALEVTLLTPGTFQSYMVEKQKAGADLAHLKPAHMNAPEDVIQMLLDCSGDCGSMN